MSFSNPIDFSKRILLTLGFMLFLSATACAYTVVMRGGKRVEIPAQFAVTKTTITYEVSPGIDVTLQMSADSLSQRPELVSWLDSLVAHRAGLQARFRMLEEEARRAGVPPGWLR